LLQTQSMKKGVGYSLETMRMEDKSSPPNRISQEAPVIREFFYTGPIDTDAAEFTSVINDAQFSQSNINSPSISLDGSKLLFASDNDVDEKGRNNYNLYIYDLETGQIQPLTDNGSDDISPAWSPTEAGVLYFLSNRRGAYNIWRMQLSGID